MHAGSMVMWQWEQRKLTDIKPNLNKFISLATVSVYSYVISSLVIGLFVDNYVLNKPINSEVKEKRA